MKALLQIHFISLFLNILLVSFIFFTKYQNIAISQVQSTNYANATQFVDIFLIISEVMFGIMLMFTIFGLPFTKQALSAQILLEVVGVICYSFYILLRMHYITISYIWGIFCLIPFLIGIVSLIFKAVNLKKYSKLLSVDQKNKPNQPIGNE